MRRQRRNVLVRILAALLGVGVVAVACAATTPLGKVKEGLLYERQIAVGILREAEVLRQQGQLPEPQFKQIVDAYVKVSQIGNLMADVVAMAEAAEKSKQPFDAADVQVLDQQLSQAFNDLVALGKSVGILKEKTR